MRARAQISRGLAAVRHVVATAIKERAARFLRNLKRAAKQPIGDSIHDLRVSVRRLAAALLAAKEACRTPSADAVLGQLDALMRPLGKTRDAQVQLDLLDGLSKRDRKALAAFIGILEEREGKFRAKSCKAMKALNAARVRKGCKQVRTELDGRWDDEAPVRREAMQAAYRIVLRCYRAVWACRLRAINRRDLNALHKMRLALKRLRYTAEILRPALPNLGEGRMNRFGKFQTCMGDIHDLDVLAGKIQAFYGQGADAQVRRVAQRLVKKRERLLAQFGQAFPAMEKDAFWSKGHEVQ